MSYITCLYYASYFSEHVKATLTLKKNSDSQFVFDNFFNI